jgi:hypothetical protein
MKQAKDQRMMVDDGKAAQRKIVPLAGTKSENLYIDKSKKVRENVQTSSMGRDTLIKTKLSG